MTTHTATMPMGHSAPGSLVERLYVRGDDERAKKWRRFKVGFKAWWEGYELVDGSAKKGAAESGAVAAAPRIWSEVRISVSQMIWGDGFTFPGGTDYALELAKPFNLGKEKSLLDVGCGLGGATRAFNKTFGCWVTGLEMSPELAAEGAQLSKSKGVARQASVKSFDPVNSEIPAQKFDAALARHVLTPVADRKQLMEKIVNSVRPGGYVQIVDFAQSQDFKATPEFEAWRAAEGNPEVPFTIATYARMLDELGVAIHISDDISADIRKLVCAGWENLSTQMSGKSVEPAEAMELAREIELWGKRLAALKSGDLAAVRIFGIKRTGTK